MFGKLKDGKNYEAFMLLCIEENLKITAFLTSRIGLTGKVVSFDHESLTIETLGSVNLIMKEHIVSIQNSRADG